MKKVVTWKLKDLPTHTRPVLVTELEPGGLQCWNILQYCLLRTSTNGPVVHGISEV